MESIIKGDNINNLVDVKSIVCNGYTCNVYTPGQCPIVCKLVHCLYPED